MDIQTLQRTVRDFAAVRHWPRFHTPKNLAMALMVEAAELLEIFQWLTPEESSAAASDAAKKQHIGEEIADVQIYLLQMAEHTRVDLSAAVLDKLQRNARKYPVPAGAADVSLPGLHAPAATGAAVAAGGTAAAAVTHVLLDFENVQPTDAELRALVPQATRLWVFHGPHQRGMAERFASFGHDLTVVPISRSGKNALDFHLSFYMGYIAARHPAARFVVVANDKGYEPMLEHARQLHFDVQAVGMPRVRKSATRTAAKPSAAPRKSSRPPATETTAPAAKTRRRTAAAPAAAPPPAAAEAKPPRKTARKVAQKAGPKAPAPVSDKVSDKAAEKVADRARSPAQAPDPAAKAAPRKARASRPADAQTPARADAAQAPAAPPSPQRAAKRAPRGAAKPVPTPASAAPEGSAAPPTPKARGARGGAATAKPAAAPSGSKPAAQPQGATRPTSPPDAAQMAKLEQGLRKLGAKRPVRLARLRGVLKSLLGGEERAAVIDTALQRLLAAGQVRVAADGAVSYPADA